MKISERPGEHAHARSIRTQVVCGTASRGEAGTARKSERGAIIHPCNDRLITRTIADIHGIYDGIVARHVTDRTLAVDATKGPTGLHNKLEGLVDRVRAGEVQGYFRTRFSDDRARAVERIGTAYKTRATECAQIIDLEASLPRDQQAIPARLWLGKNQGAQIILAKSPIALGMLEGRIQGEGIPLGHLDGVVVLVEHDVTAGREGAGGTQTGSRGGIDVEQNLVGCIAQGRITIRSHHTSGDVDHWGGGDSAGRASK